MIQRVGGISLLLIVVLIIIIAIFSGWSWEEHYDNNWQLISRWNVNEEGQKDWKWIEYYANGQKKTKWKYKNWQLDWKFISYDENGEVTEEKEYDDGELKELVQYNVDWKITNETKYKDWAEYSKKLTTYFDNGKVKEKKNFKENALLELVQYNENWKITNETEYKDWVEYSERTTYYENDKLQSKGTFVNWKIRWDWIEKYENGETKTKWEYDEDWLKSWKWVEYYENWKVKEKWNYVKDVKDWKWSFKNEEGDLIKESKYKDWKELQ